MLDQAQHCARRTPGDLLALQHNYVLVLPSLSKNIHHCFGFCRSPNLKIFFASLTHTNIHAHTYMPYWSVSLRKYVQFGKWNAFAWPILTSAYSQLSLVFFFNLNSYHMFQATHCSPQQLQTKFSHQLSTTFSFSIQYKWNEKCFPGKSWKIH